MHAAGFEPAVGKDHPPRPDTLPVELPAGEVLFLRDLCQASGIEAGSDWIIEDMVRSSARDSLLSKAPAMSGAPEILASLWNLQDEDVAAMQAVVDRWNAGEGCAQLPDPAAAPETLPVHLPAAMVRKLRAMGTLFGAEDGAQEFIVEVIGDSLENTAADVMLGMWETDDSALIEKLYEIQSGELGLPTETNVQKHSEAFVRGIARSRGMNEDELVRETFLD